MKDDKRSNPLKIKAFSVCRYYTVTALLCFDHARNWYPGSVHYGKRWMENRYRSKGCIQKCDQR